MKNTSRSEESLKAIIVTAIFFFVSWGWADSYRYKNILVGERASGLGGAFIAISDDPTGVYYNPAGIVFSSEKFLSVTSNTVSVTETRYQDVFVGKDYVYKSETVAPSFFGISRALGEKIKMGFIVAVPHSETIDQDDQFDGVVVDSQSISQWSRRLMHSNITYTFGPGIGFEVSDNLTLGVSLLGFYKNERYVEQQLRKSSVDSLNFFGKGDSYQRKAFGITPKIGLQFMPLEKWSIGLVISKPINISGEGRRKINSRCNDTTGQACNTQVVTVDTQIPYKVASPFTIGAGMAYFFSKSFLVTGDFEFNTGQDASQDDFIEYNLQPTMNGALGAELKFSDAFLIRSGFFTNMANTPNLRTDKVSQPNQVDLYGGTFAFAFTSANYSISLGAQYSQGQGRGQALNTSLGFSPIQNVTVKNTALYINGSFQL